MRFFLLLSFFCFSSSVFCQNSIHGKIIDASTKEPLAFATIIFNQNQSLVALSDIDGRFSFESSVPINTLTVRYLGYETKTISNLQGKNFPLRINLQPKLNQLEKVMVTVNKENPANEIIRKTIVNKPKNNPKNIPSFRYYSYNKTIFDGAENDSMQLFQNSHVFLMESVTKRTYKKPDLSEEVILGTKVSGFKNPRFAVLATEFQPFSFYENIITLYDIHYVNPISNGSLDKYQFRLKDTLIQSQDSVFVIAFEPIPKKNFQGLEGVLFINSNGYAIQNVTASPAEKGKVNINIQQQYQFINGKYWFPEQLNYELVFTGTSKKGDELIVEGKSYIKKVQFDLSVERNDFSLESVYLVENASDKKNSFWKKHRHKKLDSVELKTYRVLDSLGREYHFDRYLNLVSGLLEQKIPLGFVDLDLSKTFIYNQYEGFRLGTGLYTNEKISEKFTFGGYFGYGLKDEAWKYGGKVAYHPSNRFSVAIGYANDLTETGMYGSDQWNNIFNFRRYIAFRFDHTKKYFLKFDFRPFRYLQAKVIFNRTKTIPTYPYAFWSNNTVFTEYHNTSATLDLTFSYGENFTEVFGQLLKNGSEQYPVLSLSYTKGFQNIFQGDFDYNKIEANIHQSFYTRGLGTTVYKLEGGFVDNPIPYGLLFTGKGSLEDDFPVIMKNNFQTMLPYEFLSDTYANLFLSHDFGTLLFKTENFQPRIILHQNIGWGNLSQPDGHKFIAFKTMEEFYLESGLQIDNILKINYLDLGYLGLGVAGFYRYGFYSLPEFKDNLALKLTLGFTLK